PRRDRSGRCTTSTTCHVASRSVALLALRVRGIPHLAHRARLGHQPLEIVDEPFPAVFRILIMTADVDGLLGAHLLAVAAEDAPELVDLEYQRISIAMLILTRHELDAIR